MAFAEPRLWTLANGETFEADFLGLARQIASFRGTNGVQRAIWFANLSAADQVALFSLLSSEEQQSISGLMPKAPSSPRQERKKVLQTRLDVLRDADITTNSPPVGPSDP